MKLAIVSCDRLLDDRTPLAINLSACLARRGASVLLVDGDPDSGLENYAGLSESGIVLDRKGRVVMRASATQGLSLLQGYGASALETPGDERRIDKIKRLDSEFDWILFDTPADANAAFDEALSLCDAVIVPLAEREESLASLPSTLRAILERVKAGRCGKLEAVVLTRASAGGSMLESALRGLSGEFGGLLLKTRITDDPAVAEALELCQSVADRAPSSPAAKAYAELAGELTTRLKSGVAVANAVAVALDDRSALAAVFAPGDAGPAAAPAGGVFTRVLGWLGGLFGMRNR